MTSTVWLTEKVMLWLGRHVTGFVRAMYAVLALGLNGFVVWLVVGVAIHDHKPGDAVFMGLLAAAVTALAWWAHRQGPDEWSMWRHGPGSGGSGPV